VVTVRGPSGPWPIRRRDWALVAVTVLPVLALAVVALVSVGHGYHGADDNAMTELRISDIGAHWPQLGPFSRDGWSHPGPALFYALVLPYRLTGSHSNGLLVGAALVNAAAMAGTVLLARRRGGTAFALAVALGTLVLTQSLGLSFFWNPWNPLITVVPFGLAVLATWCVLCGDVWCLPLLAAVGTFCVQTHVGYLPLVGVLAAIAALGTVLRARSVRRGRDEPGGGLVAPLGLAAGVLVVSWAPPLFQQVSARTGNLWVIWHYFQTGTATHSVRDALHIVTAQFAWKPNWIVGNVAVNPFTGTPKSLTTTSWPVWWVPLAAALVWSWKRRSRPVLALGLVLVAMILTSVEVVVRTLGPILEYRLRFLWWLGMSTAAYAIWVLALARAEPARTRPRWRAIGTGVVIAATGVLALTGVVDASSAAVPNAHNGRVVAALVPQLLRRLPPGPGVVVPSVDAFTEGPILTGVMVDLEHHGIPVRMVDNRDDRLRFGDHRMLDGERVRAALRFAADDELDVVAKQRCARMLAYWGRAPRAERARAMAEVRHIERALARKQVAPAVALERVHRLAPKLPAAAIFRTDCGRD
jgi:hypothetical protein